MRGDYLYYEEKIEITPEEKDAKAARRYANSPLVSRFTLHLAIIQGAENA